jgi:hypothetical protein
MTDFQYLDHLPMLTRIMAKLAALQAEVNALKRLQAETAANEKAEIAKAETLKPEAEIRDRKLK